MLDESDKKPKPEVQSGRATETTPDKQRNSDLWAGRSSVQPEKVTAKELSQAELKELGKQALPERFHSIIEKSEVISVGKAEAYNRELGQQQKVGDHPFGVQDAARETGQLNVVVLRLGVGLECGQAHGLKDGMLSRGSYFAESIPAGRRPSEVREQFVIPPESSDKTHATWGMLRPGTVIVISEMSSSTLHVERGRTIPTEGAVRSLDSPTPDHLPPLAKELPARTYQIQVKGNPADCFEPAERPWREERHRLPRDRWH